MSLTIFSATNPLTAETVLRIATSGALDEIANLPGAVELHIRRDTVKKDGVTINATLFTIYQPELKGPQNGVRFCLVHKGFKIGDKETTDQEALAQIAKAEAEVEKGAMEWIELGYPGTSQD